MSYLIFARKFRPQDFKEVVGQDPIVRTLRNAIEQNRIPQSFLFAGPRGVGKTSTARILAKCLNCEKGLTGSPCDKCVSCREITQGNSLDVLEIDGASNRGIDEIRNLRETVKFKPTQGRFKVYIIDEVHMLTTEAFNALLKTLEEPPAHVKFVFATTEAHKVPLTILSRCQRFNFKRITIAETVKKLEEIAKKEKIKYEPNALFLIAKASEGALRDAESLLDQLATFSDDKIKEKDALSMLGLAAESVYFDILTALQKAESGAIFRIVQDLYDQGADMNYFAKGLLDLFRHLLLFQCAEKALEFMEWSESAGEQFQKRKNDFSRSELILATSILQNLQGQLRRNLAPPKLLIETTLLKLLHLDHLHSLEGEELPATDGGLVAGGCKEAPSEAGASYRNSSPQQGAKKTSALKSESSAAVTQAGETAGQPKGSIESLQEAEVVWPRVIEYVKSKKMSTGIFLSESEPVEIDQHAVILGLPAELQFHKETLEKDPNRKLVEEAFEVVSGKKTKVQFVITKSGQQDVQPEEEATAEAPSSGKLPEIITEAMNIFQGAKIVRKD